MNFFQFFNELKMDKKVPFTPYSNQEYVISPYFIDTLQNDPPNCSEMAYPPLNFPLLEIPKMPLAIPVPPYTETKWKSGGKRQ